MEQTNPYHPPRSHAQIVQKNDQRTYSAWGRIPLAVVVIAMIFTAISYAIGLPFTKAIVRKETISSIPLLPVMFPLAGLIGRGATVVFYSSVALEIATFIVFAFVTYNRWPLVIGTAILLGTINGLAIAIYY